MKTRSAKAKARRLQHEVRNAILTYFPDLHPEDVRVAIMGESGEDIKLSFAARDAVPFSIECKNTEKLSIWAALEQAEENSKDHDPLLVFRRNRSRVYAALPFDTLMELLVASGED